MSLFGRKIITRVIITLLSALLLTSCGPGPADATMECDSHSCVLQILNDSNKNMDVWFDIDYAPQNADINPDKDQYDPQDIEWYDILVTKDTDINYTLEPGQKLEIEWANNRAGLYRALVTVDALPDKVTPVYGYYDPEEPDAVEVGKRTLEIEDGDLLITMATPPGGTSQLGTAVYVNDKKWILFVDTDNSISFLRIPIPEHMPDPEYVNVESNKFDNFFEVDRDNHRDHPNAAYGAIPYLK